jgi:transcriptional regulator GlxA family with amidase domain
LASFKYISQFRQVRKVKENDVVENAILFMKENIPKKITLSDIASHVGLSASHFSLVFRTKTGRSPMDYLMHLRIQRACALLDATAMRISEIAVATGYDDPFYFSRVFKNIMNSSPVKYRKELKG